ncbi:hypothetical protein JCM10296v2_007720 [Rhodotorula toruloides]
MASGLPKLPSELARKLEEAPLAKHIVLDARRLLSKLLELDGGSGLALITLRFAELATERDRAAQQHVEAFRRHEYPDTFSRGKAQTHRLQIESLAGEVVKKVKCFPSPPSPARLTAAIALLQSKTLVQLRKPR